MKKGTNLLLVLAVVALVALPLLLPKARDDEGGFTGTDEQAKDTIQEVSPGYVPWVHSVWKPPSGEIETLLFTLQAAAGTGVLCYVLGYLRGRAARESSADGRV